MGLMPTCLPAALAACLLSACVKPAPNPETARPKPVLKSQAPKAGIVSTINLTNLFELQQSGRVLIFDARPGFVHAFGHIPGSVNWPRGMFESERARHEKEIKQAIEADQTIVIYCTDAACPDAGEVARRISKLGYPISVLDGGFAAWKEAGLPTE